MELGIDQFEFLDALTAVFGDVDISLGVDGDIEGLIEFTGEVA